MITDNLVAELPPHHKPSAITQRPSKFPFQSWSPKPFWPAIAYAILPNIPFWIANRYLLSSPRPTINIDYLIVAFISVYVSLRPSLLLFCLAWFIDVVADTTYFYYFSQHDFVASIRFIGQIRIDRILFFGVFLLCSGLVVGAGLFRVTFWGGHKQRSHQSIAVLCVCGLIVLVTASTSSTKNLKRDVYQISRLANSVSISCIRLGILGEASDHSTYRGTNMESAAAPLVNALLMKQRPLPAPQTNIVLVLVESYGLIDDSILREEIMSPLQSESLKRRYRLETGTVSFKGATVSGEFRELCGLELGLASTSSVSGLSSKCIPRELEKAGYRTSAIHGYSGYMFDRKIWWGDLGFQSAIFLEDLRQLPSLKICDGPFPGACDSDVASIIGEKLLSSPKGPPQFIYWVTLNSHLPLKKQKDESVFHCGSEQTLVKDDGLCLWASLIRKANQSVANIAALPGLPPTEFIVVGDHAPPFLSAARRDHFSQTNVPFIYLLPADNLNPSLNPAIAQRSDRDTPRQPISAVSDKTHPFTTN